ncbi:MAG: AMP-dependent synthetase/ligase [Acidimicrobiales bacterium]
MTTNDELHARVAGRTIPRAFIDTVRTHGGRTALRWKDPAGEWAAMSFSELAEATARAAAGLQALGVGPGDRVVLMLRNRPEFHVADLAALFCGATPISIYNSSSAEQVAYLAGHSRARAAVVEGAFLDRFLSVRAELPGLERLVALDVDSPGEGVGAWAELAAHDPLDLEAAAEAVSPDDLATVIYTSGTTGPPKGVMITHRNVAWTIESLYECFAELELGDPAGKRLVSYLPMAHIAERVTSHYQQAFFAYEVTTCPEPTLLLPYLVEVRPNVVFGVPRVWEKLYAGINAALAAEPEKKQKFDEGVAAALPLVEAMTWGRATQEETELWQFLDAVAFSVVRERVGLDQVEAAITGAAPIPPDILAWFRAIGVPLSEIYGMSESSGPMTWSPRRPKPGTVGRAIPGCEVRLEADGEIVCRGGNVFAGYLDDPAKTAETVDAESWLHSGDIGELDDDGYFRIVDRKKELLITAGGKNVSPANLEAALKMIPLVGQAMAVGDSRPFVAALVVLDPDAARAWAAQHGASAEDLDALAAHPDLVAEIHADLEQVMAPFNNAERVKRLAILGQEWLPDSDLLTPTSKLKRRGVLARFTAEIDALYR